MRSRKLFVTAALILAVFALGLPSTTPRVYGLATPCLTAHPCGIAILSPGPGATINKNADVNPSFIVSFLVHNITIVNPGTTGDVNTTIGSGTSGHNEGHIHVFVDNVYTTIWANLNGIPLTLTPGSHAIRLDLVNDLHQEFRDRKSTRLNSSHLVISYAVFCLKKKNTRAIAADTSTSTMVRRSRAIEPSTSTSNFTTCPIISLGSISRIARRIAVALDIGSRCF